MTTFKQNRLSIIIFLIASLLLSACSTPAADTASDANTAVTEPIAIDATQAETNVALVTSAESGEAETTIPLPTAATTDELVSDAAAPKAEIVEVEVEAVAVADTEAVVTVAEVARPDGWSDETHSNDADPNYDVVFPQDQVNTMTIVIDSADWQSMLDNMTELYGEPSGDAGGGGGRPAGGGDITDLLPEGCELPDGFVPGPDAEWPEGCEPELGAGGLGGGRPEGRPSGGPGGARPEGGLGGGGGGGINVGGDENPDYVAATIEFEGDLWTNVGVRFKGNSTLTRAWNSGLLEMPFKLDFDEFEDEYPAIDNQRFYGFKQLSLQSPSADDSYVRASLAYDVLQDAGLIAPETAWYELLVDYGQGPVSFGLYTVIEVIDDSVIDTAFGDDDGNIYEGDGAGVSLAEGTFDQIADSFEKENNDENDFSDLEALYSVLHADTRLTDADQWRSDLETVFDVDTFLNWLAVNSVMVNWDTYGEMAHNFYIYHDPETDQLTWIGWDYNEALQAGRRGGTTSLSQQEETDDWPLIRYLLDEPIYYAQYAAYVEAAAAGALDVDTVAAQLARWEAMLTPYVASSADFASQIETITNFVSTRQNAVTVFLSSLEASSSELELIDAEDDGELTESAETAPPEQPAESTAAPQVGGQLGGRPPRELDLAAAAEQLGVSEAELEAALGVQGEEPPNFVAAAAALGVTEAELMDALGIQEGGRSSADAPPTNAP